MSLEDIKKKIETDARTEAEDILEKFRTQADELLSEAKGESQKLETKLQEKISSEENEVRRRRSIVADLEVRKLMLGARRELIDMTFAKALEALSATPGDRYVSFMTELLVSSVVSGDEEVFLCKGEKNLDQKWIDDINAQRKFSLTLSPDRVPAAGGFVLRRGRIDVNCTWELLLGWAREEMEAEVVNRLFPD